MTTPSELPFRYSKTPERRPVMKMFRAKGTSSFCGIARPAVGQLQAMYGLL
jgi:hypothetical protein